MNRTDERAQWKTKEDKFLSFQELIDKGNCSKKKTF